MSVGADFAAELKTAIDDLKSGKISLAEFREAYAANAAKGFLAGLLSREELTVLLTELRTKNIESYEVAYR